MRKIKSFALAGTQEISCPIPRLWDGEQDKKGHYCVLPISKKKANSVIKG